MRANLTAHPKLRKMIREHDAGLLQLKEAKAKERLLMVQQERLNYLPPTRAATPEPGAKDQKRANFYALPEDILSAVENHTWAKLRHLDYRWYVRNVDAIATALKKRKALAAEQWLLVVNRDAGASRARLNHTDPLSPLLDRGFGDLAYWGVSSHVNLGEAIHRLSKMAEKLLQLYIEELGCDSLWTRWWAHDRDRAWPLHKEALRKETRALYEFDWEVERLVSASG
jgi:hypothetical protein